MQFQLLVGQALSKDLKYQQLKQKLKIKEQKCLKNAEDKQQEHQCMKKQHDFKLYLDEYTRQYREKGTKICSEVMKQQSSLSQKVKSKDECIQFYNKSINIFLGNVKDKLRSLVDNIDFSQL